ncbi:MAG: glycosyltransferase family 2 protein [Sediminibacterium sp.]|nr:glycosyltransferase family 2 protein [Sediminibacterium sp.]
MKKTAIILVNWNSFDLTAQCIRSLQQILDPDSVSIILVDNNSADGSGAALQTAFPGIAYIQANDNLGFTGGNNLGIAYAIQENCEYTLLLNNDTTVAPDFLVPLLQCMDTHPEIGAVQPLIYYHHQPTTIWNGGSYYHEWLGHPSIRYIGKQLPNTPLQNQQPVSVDWITGCAFLARTALLREMGGLSNNLFMYFEDIDISFRIREKGYQLKLIPQSAIWHVGGMSNKNKEKTKEGFVNPVVHYLNIRNRIWIIKHYTRLYNLPTVLIFNCLYIAGILLYFLVRVRWGKFQTACKALLDGLLGQIEYTSFSSTAVK